jgi:hypothetical protein
LNSSLMVPLFRLHAEQMPSHHGTRIKNLWRFKEQFSDH